MRMYEKSIIRVVCMCICWRIVTAHDPTDDEQSVRNKLNTNPVMERLMRYTPDMRLMLNGLLRYENIVKRPEESYPFLHLANRSKGSVPPMDDPLAVLATGFLGSRGKKDDYDEIPVFANGFPAGRG